VLGATLRLDPERLVAGQSAAGRGDGDRAGRGPARNRGLQEGGGDNLEGCGSSVEGNSRGAGESLPENFDGLPDLARGGYETDKRSQSHIKAVNNTLVVSPPGYRQPVNHASGVLHGGIFWPCAMGAIEVVKDRVGASWG